MRSALTFAASAAALSAQERLQRALYTFMYPADPVAPEVMQTLRRDDAGRRWLDRRLDGWSDALVSAGTE